MIPQLTSNALTRILSGEVLDGPVLQLVSYRKLPGNAERYMLSLSDGNNSYKGAILASQLNFRIAGGELEKHTVIKVNNYTVNKVNGDKKVMFVLGFSVLASGEEVQERIGNPISLDTKRPEENAPTSNGMEQKYKPPSSLQRPANSFTGSALDNPNQNVHPIMSLTPYQNRWTIKARVTNKTPVKTWANSRGEGKLFSVDLLDESGEIRATAFKDQCDKFYNEIEINKVYYISKASLKTANKNFTSIKNDYEMSFNSETTVIPCSEDVSSIPMLQFDFTSIAEVENVDKDGIIDVIGICKSTSDVVTIMTRASKEVQKKDIVLLDKSCKEINLTLWGSEAEKFDGSLNPVVAVKGARVSDFGGRSLSATNSCVLQINPDIREAHMLRGWYDQEGSKIQTQSITVKGGAGGQSSNWKTFAQVKAENLGLGDKPDYYNTKATVIMVKRENCLYQACPQEDCNKKVVDMQNGVFKCEKCSREYENFKWRLLLSINIADYSDSQWVTCFQESAEAILGTTAQDLGRLREMDEERFNEALNNVNFKSFTFRLRTKMDTFNEENRLKTVVFSATPLNCVEYGRKLLTDIKHLETIL